MKTTIISIVKWWIIIAFAGAVVYAVIPKWEFHPELARIVLNKVTGEVKKFTLSLKEGK